MERYKRKTDGKRPQNKNLLPPKMGKVAGSGRKKGTRNKLPTLLKDCLIRAAELEGSDRAGKDGLVGFLRQASRTHKPAFLGLLGRVLPLQINASINGEISVVEKFEGKNIKDMTLEEKQSLMREMLNSTKPLVRGALPAPVTEGEFTEVEEDESAEA